MKRFIFPKKTVISNNVIKEEVLLKKLPLQINLNEKEFAEIKGKGSITLDFGKETSGGVRILTFYVGKPTAKIHVTFGESLTETLSSIGYKNATNDHSIRDFDCEITSLSDLTFGNTGFRFVKIDFSEDVEIKIKSIVAEEIILNKNAVYSYNGKDDDVKAIFNVAKRTIDLCAGGNYVYDGVKRDRLIWVGDMHPEMLALSTLYGRVKVLEKSLDLIKNTTPIPEYMNTFPTYSAWWVTIVCDYYKQTGCKDFVKNQLSYMKDLIDFFNAKVDDNGVMHFDFYFVDWPTYKTQDEYVGSKFIYIIAVKKAIELFTEFNTDCTIAQALLNKLLLGDLSVKSKKEVIALKYFALNKITDKEYETLIKGGAKGISTFMSYYILTAIASKDKNLAVSIMKDYYSGMIKLGATTFWEDFDVEWTDNVCGIDELPKENEKDVHGDFGNYCYKGFRHSLCHGWSSGVIKFIKENC